MKFELGNYFVTDYRNGQNPHKTEEALKLIDHNDLLIVYSHDVYTHYYAVPKMFKDKIGNELLKFFYEDNCDFTEEDLKNFKEDYKEFFKV